MKISLKINLVGAALLLAACGESATGDDSNTGGMTSTGQTSTTAPNTSGTSSPTSNTTTGAPSTTAGGSTTTGGTTSSPNPTTGSSGGDNSEAAPTSETPSSTGGGDPEPTGPDSSGEMTSDPTGAASGETSAPSVTTDEPMGEDPLLADPVCSSNMSWMRGENDRMRPGEACIACHTAENEGPRYAIAGTLYPTGHEPDDCNGISGDASGSKVVITDANGQEHELTPNSVGNFFFNGNLAKPYTAKVVDADGERLMITPQENGDCNTCHSAAGTSGAPGRVVVPF